MRMAITAPDISESYGCNKAPGDGDTCAKDSGVKEMSFVCATGADGAERECEAQWPETLSEEEKRAQIKQAWGQV